MRNEVGDHRTIPHQEGGVAAMVSELKNLVTIFLDRGGLRGHHGRLGHLRPNKVTAATIFASFFVAVIRMEHSYKMREICQDPVDGGTRSSERCHSEERGTGIPPRTPLRTSLEEGSERTVSSSGPLAIDARRGRKKNTCGCSAHCLSLGMGVAAATFRQDRSLR